MILIFPDQSFFSGLSNVYSGTKGLIIIMVREIDYIIKIADQDEREEIYKIRHDVYAIELKQYAINQQLKLMDDLDLFNTYIAAKKNQKIIGFLSITPPGYKYSMLSWRQFF